MENFEEMKKDAEESIEELKVTYPSVESIVDDYRNAFISEGVVSVRFPDLKDQQEIVRIAQERNEADLALE